MAQEISLNLVGYSISNGGSRHRLRRILLIYHFFQPHLPIHQRGVDPGGFGETETKELKTVTMTKMKIK
jgi:hypothetical protein